MNNKLHIFLFFLLTILSGGATVFFFMEDRFPAIILLLIITLCLFYYILSFIFRIFRDVNDFSEAVRYHDFSKKYPEVKKRRSQFYHHFNSISNVFLSLNREKDAQQHYLKKILELVDTGILAYDLESMETLWMNEALKNMFQIPYLKNIDWLKKRNEDLYFKLTGIPIGESQLTTVNVGKQTVKMLVNASTFQTEGKTYKLIAFHNISSALEEVEADAWKGLLSIMTHEIMNSIAPVASLADTLKKRMQIIKQSIDIKMLSDFEDIEIAIETIRHRSEGLLRFAETYRNLSKNIVPQFSMVNLYHVIKEVYLLMQPSLEQKGILLDTKTDNPNVVAEIDRGLMDQVLINFITNATYAVRDSKEPHIYLFSGVTGDGHPYITVVDNGCGISPDIRDKIFIPFFSTKKKGSGIGLSLSREIVNLHKGNLLVQSQEGEGSAFTVLLKNKEK